MTGSSSILLEPMSIFISYFMYILVIINHRNSADSTANIAASLDLVRQKRGKGEFQVTVAVLAS